MESANLIKVFLGKDHLKDVYVPHHSFSPLPNPPPPSFRCIHLLECDTHDLENIYRCLNFQLLPFPYQGTSLLWLLGSDIHRYMRTLGPKELSAQMSEMVPQGHHDGPKELSAQMSEMVPQGHHDGPKELSAQMSEMVPQGHHDSGALKLLHSYLIYLYE